MIMASFGQRPYLPAHDQQFEKDVGRMKLSGRRSLLSKFKKVYLQILDQSLEGQVFLKHLRDHELVGEHKGFRELHVQHDWLIIYKVDHSKKLVYFARTGTHADLFR